MQSMRLPIILIASAALLAPATAHAAVTPPPPTGPAPVGLVRLTLTDHHRTERLAPGGGPRPIPLRVWYPAARPGSAPAQILTAAEQSTYETVFELPAHALDGIGSTTSAGAPPAAGKHPVVLLSPGWGNTSGFPDAQAPPPASPGYVLVHPQDAGHKLDMIVAKLRRHLRGPHPMRIFGKTEHAGFTDNVWLIPQLGLPTEGQELGTVTPAAAVSGQRAFLRGFFDRYL